MTRAGRTRAGLCRLSRPAAARLYADSADIVAQMQGLGELSQLLIALKMIEIRLPISYGLRRAEA